MNAEFKIETKKLDSHVFRCLPRNTAPATEALNPEFERYIKERSHCIFCDMPPKCSYPQCASGKLSNKTCSRCRLAVYCSRDCQKAHYRVHKKKCKTSTAGPGSSGMGLTGRNLQADAVGIMAAKAELAAAMKQVEEARAAAAKIHAEVASKQAMFDRVKAQEDEAKINLDKAMASLREGGLDDTAGLDKVAPAAPKYSAKEYWNKRYAGKDGDEDIQVDDWYLGFSDLKPYLSSLSREADQPILDVGCGVSLLGEELCDVGKFKRVVCIDYADVAIETMKKRAPKQGLEYLVQDASKLEFPDNYFAAAIDKGTIDAVMSGDDAQGLSRAVFILKSVYRVLKPAGKLILVSSVPKIMYMPMLTSAHLPWTIEAGLLKRDCDSGEVAEEDVTAFGTWIYVLTK